MPLPSPRSHVSGSIVLPVKAPCDVVFETLCDVKNYDSISPTVTSVEVIGSIEVPQVGAKWKETRMYQGSQIEMIKSVRNYSENDDPISVTMDNSFVHGNRWDTRNGTQSATITLEPVLEKEEQQCCRMILTYAFVADGYVAFVMTKLCGYCARRYGNKYMQQEMEYFAIEAEKRHRERTV